METEARWTGLTGVPVVCCPDCRQNPPALADSSIVWVTKWVDYSNKYGFGFMLSNDAMGVLFNDTSRILLSPEGRSVH